MMDEKMNQVEALNRRLYQLAFLVNDEICDADTIPDHVDKLMTGLAEVIVESERDHLHCKYLFNSVLEESGLAYLDQSDKSIRVYAGVRGYFDYGYDTVFDMVSNYDFANWVYRQAKEKMAEEKPISAMDAFCKAVAPGKEKA